MVYPAALSIGSCAGFSPIEAELSKCSLLHISPASSSLRSFERRARRKEAAEAALIRCLSVPPRAVAVDSNQLGSSDSPQIEKSKKYYFVVANAKFMLDEEEHFKELLSERLRNYGERNKEQDFWLVVEPKFLDQFPDIIKRLKRPAVALVSTNGPWITFMKLRLDRVLAESYEAESLEEALACNPTELRFEKPENWVAPYPKYEFGWWEPFLPPGSGNQKA